MRKPVITVVGSNMVDLITRIHRFPEAGETIEAPGFDFGYGGKGANQAVAASLLGAEVTMISRVGGDVFGSLVKKNLQHYGIDTRLVEPVEKVTNGVAPIFVEPDGSNRIFIIKGANSHLRPEDIEKSREVLLQSDCILLQLEIPLETVYCTLAFGYNNAIPVILNPAPAVELDFHYVRKASFFIPNESELSTITGLPVDSLEAVKEAAASLLKEKLKRVIVTLGEEGALLVTRETVELVPAVRVSPRDTTGAGDAFIGSFAVFYWEERRCIPAIKKANAYAALSTLETGTQKSFFSRKDFYQKYNRGSLGDRRELFPGAQDI